MSCTLNATCYPCRCVTSWMQSREQKLQACLCAAVQTPSFAPALGTLCSHSHATHQLESVWFVRGVALLPYWKTQAHHHWTSEPPAARPETERSSFLPILASPAHTMFLLIIIYKGWPKKPSHNDWLPISSQCSNQYAWFLAYYNGILFC